MGEHLAHLRTLILVREESRIYGFCANCKQPATIRTRLMNNVGLIVEEPKTQTFTAENNDSVMSVRTAFVKLVLWWRVIPGTGYGHTDHVRYGSWMTCGWRVRWLDDDCCKPDCPWKMMFVWTLKEFLYVSLAVRVVGVRFHHLFIPFQKCFRTFGHLH